MARFGLLVMVERCQGCEGCVVGCKNWNGLKSGVPGRIRLVDKMQGEYPDVKRWIFPLLCMQCQYPPCVAVCRFGACHVSDEGVVHLEKNRCVGCNLCVFACPYGVRKIHGEEHCADGCDLCLDRLREGKEPYCVATCPTGALIFGDLEDPDSPISGMIRQENARPLFPEYYTRPRVFYTHAEEIEPLLRCTWKSEGN